MQEERLLRERPLQLEKLIEEEAEALATSTAQAKTATSKLTALEVRMACVVFSLAAALSSRAHCRSASTLLTSSSQRLSRLWTQPSQSCVTSKGPLSGLWAQSQPTGRMHTRCPGASCSSQTAHTSSQPTKQLVPPKLQPTNRLLCSRKLRPCLCYEANPYFA